jgi:hypothetical protein
MNKLFTAEVPFKLVYLVAEPKDTDIVIAEFNDGNSLIEGEEITISPLSLDGLISCNNFIRKTYLTVQKEAVKDWDTNDREKFMRLAMSHIINLSMGTQEGYNILFDTVDGLCHYMWQHVKKRFPTYAEFEQVLMPNDVRVFGEIMKRFNSATLDLALLTQQEIHNSELPEEENNDKFIDDLVAKLMACGSFQTVEQAKQLTLEQAKKVIKESYTLRHGEPKEENVRPPEPVHDPAVKENIKALLG